MIKTKEDLKAYIQADKEEFKKGSDPYWVGFILRSENYYAQKFQKRLRIAEYYRNNRSKNFIFRILDLIHKIRLSWYANKIGISITPNSCGPGLRITHPAGIMISWDAKIGRNFSVRRNALIGNSLYDHKAPTIGDYVQFGVGAQAVGDVVIGRGAIISNGTVVVGKIPPYAIVVGNPGKIIGFSMTPEEVVEFEKDKYSEDERTPLELLQKNYAKYYTQRYKDIKSFLKI